MKVLNFGSLNIDYVYQVKRFALPGETIPALKMERFSGGKGLNQSVALSRAGISVAHAGCIGNDGTFLIEELQKSGVETDKIQVLPSSSGHAIIQVDAKGENTILLYPGANHEITREQIDGTLAGYGEGDILLLQNEICEIPYIMEQAHQKGMKIFFNPSPLTEAVFRYPLHLVSCFLVNGLEGASLAGEDGRDAILAGIRQKFPQARIVLTLGKDGACYDDGKERYFQSAFPVQAVDTTAAGDTFTGYFIAELLRGSAPKTVLSCACGASALAVSRMGAAPSIPGKKEVDIFLQDR